MALETATWAVELDSANPVSSDPRSEGDDHLRLTKKVFKTEAGVDNKQWIFTGDTITRVSTTAFTVPTDKTSVYETDRRMKITGAATGTIYGIVSSSTFSSTTAVNLTFDSGSLSNETLVPYVSLLTSSNILGIRVVGLTVELDAAAVIRLATNSSGADVFGTTLDLDNSSASTATEVIARNSAGGIRLSVDATTGDSRLGQTAGDGSFEDTIMRFFRNGAIEFRFDNTKEFETKSGGVIVDDELEINGALNHDGSTVGFYGVTPAARPSAYTRDATIVEDRTLLASASASAGNNNNVLAALIADLTTLGILQ